jgi:transcriptional regulator with GAF, ATPase, and Fis domain
VRPNGFAVGPIVGDSSAIREARRLIDDYAGSGLPVLIVGATGTGKELIARHIHRRSGRSDAWVSVNCAALPVHMAESLLFGHRRGAFSGAVESHRGHVRCAHGGTLFLDEVLDLPLEVQPKLLRALDFGEVQPLAEDEAEYVDLRVVAAVQDNVWARVECGSFRRDLFQRISGIVITLPPLAARQEDILPLASHFAAAQGQELSPGVASVLFGYSWPGNVRELRHAVARARALVPNGSLSAAALAEAIELGAPPSTVASQSADSAGGHLRTTLIQTLAANYWDVDGAAAALGIHRATVFRRLKRFGLSLRSLKKSQ